MCNILYTIQLAHRLNGTQATTYSNHPGVVFTEFFRVIPYKYLRKFAEWTIATFAKVIYIIIFNSKSTNRIEKKKFIRLTTVK